MALLRLSRRPRTKRGVILKIYGMDVRHWRRLRDPRWVAIAIQRITNRQEADSFLRMASGVIHVGANTGDERDCYAQHDLDVAWIEPIPDIFVKLQENLKHYPRQRAYRYLLTDKDGEIRQFHIASNDGLSSSIFELGQHTDIWPEVGYVDQITLESVTLTSLVMRKEIDINKYDTLVMDTQGSELLVLKGAQNILHKFKFIQTEVADFEIYRGCAQLRDIEDFLRANGFIECRRNKFALRRAGGSCYNILYKRI